MVLNMRRNKITEAFSKDKLKKHKQRVAFHEAGHTAGIYLNNKARHLPPVFFKIVFKGISGVTDADIRAYQTTNDDCIARVEGGRLIEFLPLSMQDLTEHKDAMNQSVKEYMAAFEADIINLLIGPLAEAKYVADKDDELFNRQLINLKALKNYGGNSDLALVDEYLQSFSADKQQKNDKLDELFTEAFEFVNNDVNWAAITKLAGYICDSSEHIIDCEEVVSILEQSVAYFQNRRSKARYHHNG